MTRIKGNIFDAIADGNDDDFSRLLSSCSLTQSNTEGLVQGVATYGRTTMLKKLLGVADKRFFHEGGFYAAQNNHLDCLRVLLPYTPRSILKQQCFRAAVVHGSFECVQEIAQEIDPEECWRFLVDAAEVEHKKIFEYLLKRCPPYDSLENESVLATNLNDYLLRNVLDNNWSDLVQRCVDILPRTYEFTIDFIRALEYNSPATDLLFARCDVEHIHKMILTLDADHAGEVELYLANVEKMALVAHLSPHIEPVTPPKSRKI